MISGERDPGFELFDKDITGKEIKSPLGNLGWHNIIMREKEKVTTRLSESQAVKIAREKAQENLMVKIKNNELPKDMKIEILSAPSDPVLRCKIAVEVIEDISKAEPINEQ